MIKSAFLRFIAIVVKSFRLKIWDYLYSESSVVNLKILPDVSSKFYGYGDITKILFGDQHLVKYGKSFESEILSLFLSKLKSDSIVFDIGANIGLFTLLASKAMSGEGTVYAFEPTKKTFDYLNKNIKLNRLDNIVTFQNAFSDKVEKVIMGPPDNRANKSFADSFNQIIRVDEKDGILVNDNLVTTTVLDQFIKEQNIDRVDVLKIDIEGAELLCFKGGENFLKTHQPVILLECLESHCNQFGYSVFDLLKFLDSCNYHCVQIDKAQWIAEPRK